MYRIYALPVALMLTCSGPIGVAAAADVAILMPGSSGIVPGDFLVRNEANFKRAGIRTILRPHLRRRLSPLLPRRPRSVSPSSSA
jgi:hypothetical protein